MLPAGASIEGPVGPRNSSCIILLKQYDKIFPYGHICGNVKCKCINFILCEVWRQSSCCESHIYNDENTGDTFHLAACPRVSPPSMRLK